MDLSLPHCLTHSPLSSQAREAQSYTCGMSILCMSTVDRGLCLPGMERVTIPSNCHLLLKPGHLLSLSPALAGSCGLLHWSRDTLNYQMLVESWLDRAPTQHDLSGMRSTLYRHHLMHHDTVDMIVMSISLSLSLSLSLSVCVCVYLFSAVYPILPECWRLWYQRALSIWRECAQSTTAISTAHTHGTGHREWPRPSLYSLSCLPCWRETAPHEKAPPPSLATALAVPAV